MVGEAVTDTVAVKDTVTVDVGDAVDDIVTDDVPVCVDDAVAVSV